MDAKNPKLKHACKRIEADTTRFLEESQNIINRQRTAIERLEKENGRLKCQLQSEHVMSKERTNEEAKTIELMTSIDMYKRKIEVEERRLEHLERQRKVMELRMLEKQKCIGGRDSGRLYDMQSAKRLKVLENRLHQTLSRFHEALVVNKQLRSEIDELRKEKFSFDSLSANLSKSLYGKKQQISLAIEKANLAYEVRDQANSEMILLKSQADKEQNAFHKEWRELVTMLGPKWESQGGRASSEISSSERTHDCCPADNENIKGQRLKKAAKLAWKDPNEERKDSIKLIKAHEEAFDKIKTATGLDSIDQFVQTFIDKEEKNFALYTYVDQLNIEMRKLEEEMKTLSSQLVHLEDEHNPRTKQLALMLENKLASVEAQSEKFRTKTAEAEKALEPQKAAIKRIFERIRCNQLDFLYDSHSSEITDSDVLKFLAAIEQRANDLLWRWRSLHASVKSEQGSTGSTEVPYRLGKMQHTALGSGPSVPAGAGNIRLDINPPSIFDVQEIGDSDEEDTRPLTRDELRETAGKMLTPRRRSLPGACPSTNAIAARHEQARRSDSELSGDATRRSSKSDRSGAGGFVELFPVPGAADSCGREESVSGGALHDGLGLEGLRQRCRRVRSATHADEARRNRRIATRSPKSLRS